MHGVQLTIKQASNLLNCSVPEVILMLNERMILGEYDITRWGTVYFTSIIDYRMRGI